MKYSIESLRCHDCNVAPGEKHISGCDSEQCSVCGEQWISCGHKNHDPNKSRWTGMIPNLHPNSPFIDNHVYSY